MRDILSVAKFGFRHKKMCLGESCKCEIRRETSLREVLALETLSDLYQEAEI